MDAKTALVKSFQYHALALVPTLIGIFIAAYAIWNGLLEPLADALLTIEQPNPDAVTGAIENADYSLAIALAGTLFGYLIHRVGRTAAMFKIHGDAVIKEVEGDVIDSPTNDDGDANERENEATEIIEGTENNTGDGR